MLSKDVTKQPSFIDGDNSYPGAFEAFDSDVADFCVAPGPPADGPAPGPASTRVLSAMSGFGKIAKDSRGVWGNGEIV